MKTLFVAPVGEISSLTSVSLGVVKALEQAGLKVGFLKPISQNDNHTVALYKNLFRQSTPAPLSEEKVESYIREDLYEQILEDIVAKIDEFSSDLDVIVIEGFISDGKNPFASHINVDIVRTLHAGIILAGNSGNNNALDITQYLDNYSKLYSEAQSWFAGYILNRVTNPASLINIQRECKNSSCLNLSQLGLIPQNNKLTTQEEVIDYIAKNLSLVSLIPSLDQPKSVLMPPAAFCYQLIEKARKANKRIVLPEGTEPRTIRAAVICTQKNIARCVLLGDKTDISKIAEENGLTLPSDIEIINPNEIRDHYVKLFVEKRKHRGATEEIAKDALKDDVVLGTMMLANGDVDGLVSGAVHTTADTIRPALQLIGTDKNSSIISSVFFMLMPDQVHVYGDCAVNPNPTPEQLADIALQSATSASVFGIEPRVALISYSTGSSGSGKDVDAVIEATKIAKAKAPQLAIDGPLQFDAAAVPNVGKQKAPNSPVAGRATVYIYPDLNTGNTTYKAVQRTAKIISIGPMLQGLAKPVNDLSRGALVDDIVYTIALTAIQALNK